MVLAAHQLHYLPWLRYFHKIAASDVFVVMDDVQFNRNGWQNRTCVKHARGATTLTVPVRQRSRQPIDQVRIDPSRPWQRKHWMTLQQGYARAPHLPSYAARFEAVFSADWDRLCPLSEELLSLCLDALAIRTRVVRSSSLGIETTGSDRLAAFCRAVGADTYLSGSYALRTYLDRSSFDAAGIRLIEQVWQCPEYGQQHQAAGFVADLSIVDLLFNHGPASRAILMGDPDRPRPRPARG